MNKPYILGIVGESGSGKTEIADYIQKTYNIKMIESYTDRERRTPSEIGHSFVTPSEFNTFSKEDMIAYTKFGDYRYCCLKQDVLSKNTYVIDEYGLDYLIDNYSAEYEIESLRVIRDEEKRIGTVGNDRVNRDKGKFTKKIEWYDYTIDNNGTMEDLRKKIDSVVIASGLVK